LKTVALEWPEIKVKSVDLNLKVPPSILADHLLAEILSDDGLVEVGYVGSHRLALGLTDAPLAESAEDMLQMDSAWVLLITGGARGITAEVACNLAQRYQPTLILAGRSAVPPENESDLTVGLSVENEIKSALISEEREIRANLAAMRQAGAQVSYAQVDVRDEQQFGDLIDSIYQNHGRLDGVIHGAGIIKDKLLTDKSWESFDRVFGTKTDSVFVLSKKLRPETLKFLVMFSSVAGRFGNAGQCDYTAANDVLNKMAVYLDNRWSGRVLSVNWGPWAGSGMASAEVQKQFNQRGVALISPSQGPESLDLELRKGHKGESEVVIGEGPWSKAVEYADGDTATDSDLPLLQKNISIIKDDGFIEVSRRLDPDQDLYLQDHRLDAKLVLPAAMAIELMAEAAQMGWPQWKVTTVSGVRVFKGIVLNNNLRDVRLILQAQTNDASPSNSAKLEVKITDPQQSDTIFYQATVNLNKNLPVPKHYEIHTNGGMDPFWTSAGGAYEKWLFHGSKFQCIQHIHGISKKGMIATMRPSLPGECLAGEAPGKWLIDPIVIDGGLQLALLWARNYLDITTLPSSFEEVHIFRPFHLSSTIQCHLEVIEKFGKQSTYSNIYYTDQEYTLLAMIKGYEATGSKGLNRLAGSHLSSILSEKVDADDQQRTH
jgi:NAD(P)-dependent dehydrogenase (short-subunit alcohol dehydrogenase family)